MQLSRRSLAHGVVGVFATGCQRGVSSSSPLPSPSSSSTLAKVAAPLSMPDLAWHNLSLFHGDGDRLAFARDGRVLYERIQHGKLLRWELKVEASAGGELTRIADRLVSEHPVPTDRPGIPDEVRVRVHYRSGESLVEVALWENDIGKLPHEHSIVALRAGVAHLAERLVAASPGRPVSAEDAGQRWPRVLESAH